jgi:abortive infection alpha-like protein
VNSEPTHDADADAPREPEQDAGIDEAILNSLPGIARIYASAWWHTAEWTLETSLHAGSRVLRAALSGERPSNVLESVGADTREYARRLLQVIDPDGRVLPASVTDRLAEPSGNTSDGSAESLRARGEDLLRRSADVREDESVHPAYVRILAELAPDEGRILRLLAVDGPQPAVDVRAGLPLVSQLIAPGRSMIGAEAGCRYVERVPAYLNNLYRLGLIWFSREPVKDNMRYQVVEAQPDVLAAMRKGGRTSRTTRRSILLTPFGRDFCELALPLGTTEIDAVMHDAPEANAEPQAGQPAS